MNLNIGIMSYLFRYWRGTYPLLLIEVQSKDSSVEDVSYFWLAYKVLLSAKLLSRADKVTALFGKDRLIVLFSSVAIYIYRN